MSFKGATAKFPLGFIEVKPLGWDRPLVRFGRALWRFKRDGFALTADYLNLVAGKTYRLGVLSPATTDEQLLQWFAAQRDSHTAADWLDLDGRIMSLSPDVGNA